MVLVSVGDNGAPLVLVMLNRFESGGFVENESFSDPWNPSKKIPIPPRITVLR